MRIKCASAFLLLRWCARLMLPASTGRSSYDKVRVQGSLDPFGEVSIQHFLDNGKSHPAKRLAWDVHRGERRGHQFRHWGIHCADDGYVFWNSQSGPTQCLNCPESGEVVAAENRGWQSTRRQQFRDGVSARFGGIEAVAYSQTAVERPGSRFHCRSICDMRSTVLGAGDHRQIAMPKIEQIGRA